MSSTMRTSSDSERLSLHPSSTSSPPLICPQVHSVPLSELPTPPKSSPSDSEIKREAQEFYKRLQDLHSPEWIGEEGNQEFFRVTPAVWLALQDEILLNNDKFSCHYDAKEECLEVKMPSEIHESVKGHFVTAIWDKLCAMKERAPANSAVREIISSIKYQGELAGKASGEDKRRPDVAFVSGQRRKPSLVVEIGHSQNGATEFNPIADKYIGGSKGRIRTMIGLDIEYRTPDSRERLRTTKRWATYQIYRSRINKKGRLYPHTTKEPVVFQNVHGVVNPRAKFRLDLADFIQSDAGKFPQYRIEISHQELCDIIAKGDETQDDYDETDCEDNASLEYSPIHKGSPAIDDNDRSSSSIEAKGDKDTAYVGKRARHTSDDATSVSKRRTRSSGAPTSENATPVGARQTRNSKRGRAASGRNGSGVAAKRTKTKKR
ncbi:hypothetical protein J4E83_009593 [Alternaria metachromatica]|uniref:uncharacterized protein n=1 Tax=Alternaria metachromatica TaxID=283354 RepID=UPI0020C43415|nr:uncharacterized protein J4E83_009593 [Alternaria metachromatica]KAI4607410.1 hypothetical protein J4E83_009593 [Alternaria metachromatica]